MIINETPSIYHTHWRRRVLRERTMKMYNWLLFSLFFKIQSHSAPSVPIKCCLAANEHSARIPFLSLSFPLLSLLLLSAVLFLLLLLFCCFYLSYYYHNYCHYNYHICDYYYLLYRLVSLSMNKGRNGEMSKENTNEKGTTDKTQELAMEEK